VEIILLYELLCSVFVLPLHHKAWEVMLPKYPTPSEGWRDGLAEEFPRRFNSWATPQEVKSGMSSAKDGVLERLRCGTIQKEVS